LINNFYSEELKSALIFFKSEQDVIKDAIIKELKHVLRKSPYDSVSIYNGVFFAFKDGEELEDEKFDSIISHLIHDFDSIDVEEMCFEFFRGKDF
jgi:hypothetical protein